MEKKKYYLDIDVIRLISCIAILLYHLGILKGGYEAVCTFFVLSGYLSCISLFKKEKVSLLPYYMNRLLKIYLPLIIVVTSTLSVMYFFNNIVWLSLKPETTSVLLGYNNFWQINANLDYFARHINSPFIHLWYISILLQFDLVFPLIFIIFKKLGDKINKIIPCLFSIGLSVISAYYLYKTSNVLPLMNIYYGTFTRVFSLIFGMTIGFIHSYYRPFVPKIFREKFNNRFIFYGYLLFLIGLFIFINPNSIYTSISFIIVSLISCRLIDYGTIIIKDKLSIFDKIIKYLSSLSYGIYLFQYPVIYYFQYININYKLELMILIIIVLASILNLCVSFKKNEKCMIIKWIIRLLVIAVTIYGSYTYFKTQDHTAEMKELEQQLAENAKINEQKQAEYSLKLKQEQDEWNSTLSDLENGEEKIADVVSNLPLVGIGDSIMLGAVSNMTAKFPNSYFDAKVSRSAWSVDGILKDMKERNILGNPVIFNLGANGDCSESCRVKIMNDLGNRQVFWLTVTNDYNVHFNAKIKAFAEKYSNLHIIDWNAISSGHPEYFYADGIHLTSPGRVAYTKAIYDTLYGMYLKEFNAKKDEILKQHENDIKTKISFYGNDILLNIYDDIQSNYVDSKLVLKKDYDFNLLKDDINKAINDDTLTYKLVFAFDSIVNLDENQYKELIDLCKGHEIYIISSTKQSNDILSTIKYDYVHVIDFYHSIEQNNDYLMVDKVHLSPTGNDELNKIIIDNIK